MAVRVEATYCQAVHTMMLATPTLTGRHVQLEPLRHEHAGELLEAATEQRDTYGWTPVPGTLDEMQRYVDLLRAAGLPE